MASKIGLISVGFGIIGIIFLFLVIMPLTSMATVGWGSSSNMILYYSIELLLGILTVGLGFYGRTKDESKAASTAGLVIGFIIIVAWILALLWYIM